MGGAGGVAGATAAEVAKGSVRPDSAAEPSGNAFMQTAAAATTSAGGLSGAAAAAAAGAAGAAGMVGMTVGMTERGDGKSGGGAAAAAGDAVANGGGAAAAAEGKVAIGRLPREDGDGSAAAGTAAGAAAGAVAADGSATVKSPVDSVAAAHGASSATKHDEWVRVPVRAVPLRLRSPRFSCTRLHLAVCCCNVRAFGLTAKC